MSCMTTFAKQFSVTLAETTERRAIARLMDSVGPNGLMYLAAAVSDFFIPPVRISSHGSS